MSTKFKVEVNEIMEALKKAKMSVKDGYMISVNCERKSENGHVYANITSGDGNTQVVSSFLVVVDKACKGGFSFVCGPEFAAVISTMAEIKKDIVVEVSQKSITLICGGARTVLGTKEKIELLDINKSEDQYCVEIKTEELRKLVSFGGYRPSVDDTRGFKNMLQITPVLRDTDTACLRVVTTDCYCIASCRSKVGAISTTLNEDMSYGVSCDKMHAFVSVMKNEKTTLFFTKNQIVISNGNDFYIFRVFNTSYPPMILDTVNVHKKDFPCTVQVCSKELDTALALVLISNKQDGKPVIMKFKDEKMILYDAFGKSRIDIEAKIEGEFAESEYICSASFLKLAVSKAFSISVTLCIRERSMPLYVIGEYEDALGVVFPMRNFESEDKKEGE